MDLEVILNEPHHHAYLIFTTTPLKPKRVDGVRFYELSEVISVEQARQIQEYARATTGETVRKICIVAPDITLPAQHALLKTLEDLQENVYFFICLPPGLRVLPTLMSRCYIIESLEDVDVVKKLQSFFTASPAERITYIDTIWQKEGGTRTAAILAFLQGCEVYAHKHVVTQEKRDMVRRIVTHIAQTRRALADGIITKSTLQLFAFV